MSEKHRWELELNKKRFVFDLFAGCGGLSTGLELAGFDPALVCELDKDARQSYLMNRYSRLGGTLFAELSKLHFSDINELDTSKINELKTFLAALDVGISFEHEMGSTVDLVCGGPPCQGYSGIGHRRSYSVDKKDLPSNQLFAKMAAFIESIRPKMFLFENVKGILSGRWTAEGIKGEIWADIRARFRQIPGYQVRWSLVHAKDYGVPQNRPRVLLIGIRDDIVLSAGLDVDIDFEDAIKTKFLPVPSGRPPDPEELLGDLVDPTITQNLLTQVFPKDFATTRYLTDATTEIQRKLRTLPNGKLMPRGHVLTEQEYSKHSSKIVSKFQHMQQFGGVIPDSMQTKKFAQRVVPRVWKSNGPSITATSLPDDYVHFSQTRSFTVREWARLQMFPDWYQFSGKRTTGGIRRAGNPKLGNFDREVPKYTQIGNAVPVHLAEAIGVHFLKILGQAEKE